MSQKGTTPDERFLIAVYKTAMKGGDPFQAVNCRGVARSIGLKETALKNIMKHLAQANLIKKVAEDTVYLTQRGCDLVLDELIASHAKI